MRDLKTVFITGTDKGLGLELAQRFLEGGFFVFAGQYLPGSAVDDLRGDYPESLIVLPLDVGDADSVKAAAEAVTRQHDGLDVLINNAALSLDTDDPLEPVNFDHAMQMMNVNAFGPLRMAQQFLPLLRAGKMKTIINISSEAASMTDCWRNGKYGYCMSKAALNMESNILRNALRPEGFHIRAIHPGWLQTDMGRGIVDYSFMYLEKPGSKEPTDDPVVSAAGVFQIVTEKQEADAPLFVDFSGKEMPY
jgi:NAD(P)-dependent dehydrogenase (short-subunit alcohol dehydrogenase family)